MVSGRVADPSIFMAPMMYEFGWDALDHARLGAGNGIGHLMECGAQVTGGYFPDPGFKDVPQPWNLAFPIAEVAPDGNAVITKVAGTRRRGQPDDRQGAAALRGARPGGSTSRRTWWWTSPPRGSSRPVRTECG